MRLEAILEISLKWSRIIHIQMSMEQERMNVKTGKVSYYDAKMKICAPKPIRSILTNTVTNNVGLLIKEHITLIIRRYYMWKYLVKQ